MSKKEGDILAEIMIYARNSLLEARRDKDQASLIRLQSVFDWLEDVCIEKKYVSLAIVFSDLRTSAMDSRVGVDFKSHIPSESDIHEALLETRKLRGGNEN